MSNYYFVSAKEVRKLVEAYLISHPEETMTGIAAKMGWYQRPGSKIGDSTRLKRRLGICPYLSRTKGKYIYTINMRTTTAEQIIKVLNIDPIDIDGL